MTLQQIDKVITDNKSVSIAVAVLLAVAVLVVTRLGVAYWDAKEKAEQAELRESLLKEKLVSYAERIGKLETRLREAEDSRYRFCEYINARNKISAAEIDSLTQIVTALNEQDKETATRLTALEMAQLERDVVMAEKASEVTVGETVTQVVTVIAQGLGDILAEAAWTAAYEDVPIVLVEVPE